MGVITTPFFNYEFHASQAEDDPGTVVWQRLITSIIEPARVFAGPFEEVFGQRFNEMEIAIQDALDLESIVDHIEDCEPANLTIDYDKDLTWCEIQTAEKWNDHRDQARFTANRQQARSLAKKPA